MLILVRRPRIRFWRPIDVGRHGVIMADPPWLYRQKSCTGAAEDHYNLMKARHICEIPVARWAARDCILFCWGTWPCVPEIVDVMRAWEFEHVTGFPLIKCEPNRGKIATGIGFWMRGASEFMLIGRKGNPRRLGIDLDGLVIGAEKEEAAFYSRKGDHEGASFFAPRGDHSVKPIRVTTWIEKIIPDAGSRLELFGRRPRQDWTVLGRKLGVELGPYGARPFVPEPPSGGLWRPTS